MGCLGARGEREYALGRAGKGRGSREVEEGLLSELWAALMSTQCASIK